MPCTRYTRIPNIPSLCKGAQDAFNADTRTRALAGGGMTEPRHASYDETPFGAWVRRQPEIESRRTGLSVTDIDWCFHKFKTSVDRLGTREIQLMLMVELKTY